MTSTRQWALVALALSVPLAGGGYHLYEQRYDDPCESLALSIPMAQFESTETDDGLRLSHQLGDVYRNDSDFERIDIVLSNSESGEEYHTHWRDLVNAEFPIQEGDYALLPVERIPFELTPDDELTVSWMGYNRAIPDSCDKDAVSHTALDATKNQSGAWVTNGPWPDEA